MSYSTSGLWQAIVIFVSLCWLGYMYIKHVRDVKKELAIAALISLAWVYMSGLYIYKESNYVFLGLNIFTFVAWTTGLVLLREIYEEFPAKSRFVLATILYLALIPTLEWIGYNVWMIQLNSDFAGLFGLPLMHMPWYGQLYYLSIGPLYLLATKFLRVR